MTRPLLAALLLAACASQVPYTRAARPCQAEAVDLVWHQVLGRTDRPPDVWWVPPAAQTCGVPTATGARGFVATTGACVGGVSWRDGADLVWYGSWERTALAHELVHVAQARDGLPQDVDHHTAPFLPGGALAVANARLAAAGLCGP
jgi:hypothetical protein